ncbi:hypothetical protein KC19_8G189200 [Ceratodon purpureus]|uniref:Uncharacterized protein n=1 Tax=Ceratodon purpureus TaxID=3225 RepID=A0A8T0GZZ9_CERPU|nr:hypothetical protein KC19_8G189200 [Ceratodon purpureus]
MVGDCCWCAPAVRIFLSTRDYASVVYIDKEANTVTAQAGIQLRELVNQLADARFSLLQDPY